MTEANQAATQGRASRRTRWDWIAEVVLIDLVALVGVVAFVYQPLVPGSVAGYDDHLLIEAHPVSPETGYSTPQYRYRFHANTSYYTVFSLRNQGPIALTVLGIDPGGILAMIPSIEPVELRYGSSRDDPFGVVAWKSAAPFAQAVVEPNAELTLWIRWRIGPCEPSGLRPYMANSGVARDSIPLRWSILGLPHYTTVDLGYTVAFEVTPKDFATECEPALAFARDSG